MFPGRARAGAEDADSPRWTGALAELCSGLRDRAQALTTWSKNVTRIPTSLSVSENSKGRARFAGKAIEQAKERVSLVKRHEYYDDMLV